MKHENNMLLVPFQFEVYISAPNTTSTTSGGHSMSHMTMGGTSTSTTTGDTMNETTGMKDMDNSAEKSSCAIFMLFLTLFICIF